MLANVIISIHSGRVVPAGLLEHPRGHPRYGARRCPPENPGEA